jgi:hypothetical protein
MSYYASASAIKCVSNPSLSLGSNQVLLGGITFPLSAISNNCWMVTGCRTYRHEKKIILLGSCIG